METKSLTYEDLARALGIAVASAKRLAIRRKWAKSIGNDGKTRVSVPVERLPPPSVTADNRPSDITGVTAPDVTGDTVTGATTDSRQLLAYLEARISELSNQLSTARAEVGTLTSSLAAERVSRFEAEKNAAVAQKENEGLEIRLKELKTDIDHWRQQASDAQKTIREATQKRRWLPRWFAA